MIRADAIELEEPPLDGWDGAHGRVGLMSEWDELDAERDAFEHEMAWQAKMGRRIAA